MNIGLTDIAKGDTDAPLNALLNMLAQVSNP